MQNSFNEDPSWTSHEMKMLNHVEVFLSKPAIMKKAEGYLNALGDEMMRELTRSEIPFPAGTKLNKVQLARGENNNGFPYLSLDIPQMFTKTEMFTSRTLFWWGHYLGFSLILKGELLPRYARKLIENKNNLAWDDVYLATAPTPWEWTRSDDNFIEVNGASDGELEKIIERVEYIKVIRFFPMSDPSFPSIDWVAEGITAWRDLSSLAED
jgi:hypothetical protein